MPVPRSALARRAASAARLGSAPTSGAITRARASIRSTRSYMVPSLAWKVTPFSFSSRLSRETLRSSSQKKRASLSRADSTLALPFATSPPPSRASMLATTRKWGARPPVAGSRTAKYFWWVRMEVRITSGGRSRKAGSMRPRIGTGHSARPATSSSSPSSSTSSRPRAKQRVRAPARMRSRRSSASRTTKFFFSPAA